MRVFKEMMQKLIYLSIGFLGSPKILSKILVPRWKLNFRQHKKFYISTKEVFLQSKFFCQMVLETSLLRRICANNILSNLRVHFRYFDRVLWSDGCVSHTIAAVKNHTGSTWEHQNLHIFVETLQTADKVRVNSRMHQTNLYEALSFVLIRL